MLNLVSYYVRIEARSSSVLIWVMAFPLILAALFSLMLSGMSSNATARDIPVGVVTDASYNEAPELAALLEGLAEPGTGAGGDAEGGAGSNTAVREEGGGEAGEPLVAEVDKGAAAGAASPDSETVSPAAPTGSAAALPENDAKGGRDGDVESDPVSDSSAPALFDLTTYDTEDAASSALMDGEVTAYITVDANGVPTMHVSPSEAGTTRQAVIQAVLDRYVQARAAVSALVQSEQVATSATAPAQDGMALAAAQSQTASNAARSTAAGGEAPTGSDTPLAQSDAASLITPDGIAQLVSDLSGDDATTTSLDILRVAPSEMARYYYALLGFTGVMGCNVATGLVERIRANLTPVGARCQVAAASPIRQLMAALVAAWLVSFTSLMLAFGFIHYVAGVSFGGREALVPVACAASSLVASMLGAVVGALPGLSLDVKDTIGSVLVTVLSLFSGLYGEPAMDFSTWMGQHLPWLQAINPAVQMSEAFFNLTYHDSLMPFAGSLAALAAMALVLFGIGAFLMRRQSYARL